MHAFANFTRSDQHLIHHGWSHRWQQQQQQRTTTATTTTTMSTAPSLALVDAAVVATGADNEVHTHIIFINQTPTSFRVPAE